MRRLVAEGRLGARLVAGHVVHLTDPERLARPGNPRREQMEAAHGADVWRQVTLNNQALFADIADFTPMSAGLPPEAVVELRHEP